MKKTLLLMVGPSGAGKSYWAHKFMEKHPDATLISRDAIRFVMLKDGEDYFAHEDTVFESFCKNIQAALDTEGPGYVIADATHNNEKSRNLTLNKLKLDNVNVIPVVVHADLRTCLEHNNQRTGRARVPRKQIERFIRTHQAPEKDTREYFDIWNITN